MPDDTFQKRCYPWAVSTPAHAARVIPLASGPALAIEEYGAAAGPPVLFFHGWPSAAVQGALLHAAALGLAGRAIDRMASAFEHRDLAAARAKA